MNSKLTGEGDGDGVVKKMSESQTGAGNLKTLKIWKLENLKT